MSEPVVAVRRLLPESAARDHRDRQPEEEAHCADEHGRELEPPPRPGHGRRDQGDRRRGQDEAQRVPDDPDDGREDRDRRQVPGYGLGRTPPGRLVEDLAVGVQRPPILSARATAARAVRAYTRPGAPCGRGGRRRGGRRRWSKPGGGESGVARTPAGPPPPRRGSAFTAY